MWQVICDGTYFRTFGPSVNMRFWSLSVNQIVWSSSGKARIWGGPPDCRLSELAIMFGSPYRVGELFIIKLNFSTEESTLIVQQVLSRTLRDKKSHKRPELHWRIQDFSESRAPTPERVPTYYLANFSQKVRENEEILGQRRWYASSRLRLDPPM